jgi:hypothetical protein
MRSDQEGVREPLKFSVYPREDAEMMILFKGALKKGALKKFIFERKETKATKVTNKILNDEEFRAL